MDAVAHDRAKYFVEFGASRQEQDLFLSAWGHAKMWLLQQNTAYQLRRELLSRKDLLPFITGNTAYALTAVINQTALPPAGMRGRWFYVLVKWHLSM
jgi:hypothetical protein